MSDPTWAPQRPRPLRTAPVGRTVTLHGDGIWGVMTIESKEHRKELKYEGFRKWTPFIFDQGGTHDQTRWGTNAE